MRPGTIALAGATTVAIAAGAYLAAGLVAEPPGSHAGTSGPVLASVIAVLVLWGILGLAGETGPADPVRLGAG